MASGSDGALPVPVLGRVGLVGGREPAGLPGDGRAADPAATAVVDAGAATATTGVTLGDGLGLTARVAGTAPAWPGTATAWSSPSPGATAAPTEWSPGLRVAVLVSVGVLALGSCLNWVKASAGGFTVTRGGLYGDGKLTLGLAVLVAVLFFVVSQKNLAAGLTIAGGVLAALIAFYDIGDIKKRAADLSTSSVGVSATIGIGLILCAIAGVALVITGIVGVSEARRT